MEPSRIKSNIKVFRDALLKYERAQLLAVSKTKSIDLIKVAYDLGQENFGENKVLELLEKSEQLFESCPKINWHFIGHLQSNKINSLLKVKRLVSIHSIDSIKLLNKLLNKIVDKKIGLFLQYNVSGEMEKSGFDNESEIFDAIDMIEKHPSFYLQGLMTIGRIRTSDFEKDARIGFEKLASLKNKIETHYELELELSMGMSADYKVALECGSNWIRVGSGLFGSREDL